MMAFATPATANTLTFQGVTFQTLASGNTLQLIITNALNATGDWLGVGFLQAFEIKDIGNVTGATLSGWNSTVTQGLAGNTLGCGTGGTPGACFYQASGAVPLTDSMSFSMAFAGTNLNFNAPSLKVQFLTNLTDSRKTGSLLSQTLPPVAAIPEPEIYAMMAVGLGLIGWVARRKKLKEAGAA